MLLIEGTIAGPSRELLGQCSNQAQEFLLLWPAASPDKKSSNLDISDLATGGEIGLMPHEHPMRIRIDGEQPPITVGAEVNLSGSDHHANCPSSSNFAV
jgi:hypothetical protein